MLVGKVDCKTSNVDLVTVFLVASKINGTSYKCVLGRFSEVTVHLSKDLLRAHVSNNKFRLLNMIVLKMYMLK